MKALRSVLSLLAIATCLHAQSPSQSFVQRNGTHLALDGKPFRYSVANIEWLGLEG